MTSKQTNTFERAYDPVFQALLTFGGVVVVVLVSAGIRASGWIEVPVRFPWMTAAAFMLCFSMFNSVFALSARNMTKYWSRSIYSFLGLAAASGFLAYLVTSIPIGDAGSYRWIYIVVTIGYMVFLSMMTFIKGIVEFAQKEEWHHPRIRRSRGNKNPRDGFIK